MTSDSLIIGWPQELNLIVEFAGDIDFRLKDNLLNRIGPDIDHYRGVRGKIYRSLEIINDACANQEGLSSFHFELGVHFSSASSPSVNRYSSTAVSTLMLAKTSMVIPPKLTDLFSSYRSL